MRLFKKGKQLKKRKLSYDVNLENPISSYKEDLIGYETEVKRIKNAIKGNANMIGIISDYGSGKSSIVELLKNSLNRILDLSKFKYKVIKINLWDDELAYNNNNTIKNVDDAIRDIDENVSALTKSNNLKESDCDDFINNKKYSVVKFHKSFIRQLSMQLNCINNNYTSKKLNSYYGAAKISVINILNVVVSFAAYCLVCCLIYYFLLKNLNLLNIDFKIGDYLNLFRFFIIIFILLYLLFNNEVLFSFWNSSKQRYPSEEDITLLYNEIIAQKFSLKKHLIIVIEDLDRIGKNELVKHYINEIYRVYIEGNHIAKKSVTFIFCLKEEYNYTLPGKNSDLTFDKLFDFTCYIPNLCVDDYENILVHLIKKDKLLSTIYREYKNDINLFRWLITGNNLNIRKIKKRLEDFKELYLNIYNKSLEPDINIQLCSFVVYLRNDYMKEINEILKGHFIPDKIKEKIVNGYVEQLKDEELSEGERFVKNKIIDLINKNLIDSDYKKYFYNFSKFNPGYTVYQKYMCDMIFGNGKLSEINLEELHEMSNQCDYTFLKKQVANLKSLSKDIPCIVLFDDNLLQLCISDYRTDFEKLFMKMFELNANNYNDVCQYVDQISLSRVNTKILASYYVEALNNSFNNESNSQSELEEYRIKIMTLYKNNIDLLDENFSKYNLSKKELFAIEDISTQVKYLKYCLNNSIEMNDYLINFNKNYKINDGLFTLFYLLKFFNDKNILFKIPIIKLFEFDSRLTIYKYIVNKYQFTINVFDKLNYLNYLEIPPQSIEKFDSDVVQNLSHSNKVSILFIKYISHYKYISPSVSSYLLKDKNLCEVDSSFYELLKKDNIEKYYAFKCYNENKIDPFLLEKKGFSLLQTLYLKYEKLATLYYSDNKALNILIKRRAYKKLDDSRLNSELLYYSTAKQNFEMINYFLQSKRISIDLKSKYIDSIVDYNEEVAYCFYNIIKSNNQKRLINLLLKQSDKFADYLSQGEKRYVSAKKNKHC